MMSRRGLDEKTGCSRQPTQSTSFGEWEGTSHCSGQFWWKGYLRPKDWVALQQARRESEQSEFAAAFPVRLTRDLAFFWAAASFPSTLPCPGPQTEK